MAANVEIREIAVFGESGSGKTVLLSSFYGGAIDPSVSSENTYRVLADDTSQGARLKQNYLRMRNEAEAPATTRFKADPYSFTIKPRIDADPKAAQAAAKRSFTSLRLVWHDYPGEWFTEEPGTAEEQNRRTVTFRNLLKSDVAFILVDGQKLLDYSGEEGRYLKSLFWGINEGLERLRDDILTDGSKFNRFPRIWLIALSKADLHPSMTARDFEELVIQKSAGDLESLRETVASFVQVPEALSLGEDFLLLSSAQFQPERIELTNRVGLNLVLPVATMLPLERLAKWMENFNVPLKMLGGLANRADEFAKVVTASVAPFLARMVAKIPKVGGALAVLTVPLVELVVSTSTEKIEEVHAQALKDRDYVAATLSQFRLDLDNGVTDGTLVKSPW